MDIISKTPPGAPGDSSAIVQAPRNIVDEINFATPKGFHLKPRKPTSSTKMIVFAPFCISSLDRRDIQKMTLT